LRLRLVPSFNSRAVLYCTYIVNNVQILSLSLCISFPMHAKEGWWFCRLFVSLCCIYFSFAVDVFLSVSLLVFLGDGLCDQIKINFHFHSQYELLCIIEFMSPKSFFCPSNYCFKKINENSIIIFFLNEEKLFYCFIGLH